MRIAIDAGILNTDKDYEAFIKAVFLLIAEKFKGHHFTFISDDPSFKVINPGNNTNVLIVTPKRKNFITLAWWYKVKLPMALKRQQVDVLICANGLASNVTSAAQVLMFNDLSFIHTPERFSRPLLSFYKNQFHGSVKKSKAIITLSNSDKQVVEQASTVTLEKLAVTNPCMPVSFKPIDWELREEVKEKYAKGWEYFIFYDSYFEKDSFITVLKAFSNFKKWQKTNLKLLIVQDFTSNDNWAADKLQSYKYRNEVIVIQEMSTEILAEITSSAYAMISLNFKDTYPWKVAKALASEVPVIAALTNNIKELAGDAVLGVDPLNALDIADKMKIIYKDEQLRSQLIESGKKLVFNDIDKVASEIWKTIQTTVSR